MINSEQYLKLVGIRHRKQFAQYFTPEAVASFMVNWVRKGNPRAPLFDPAFGLGNFWECCPASTEFHGQDIDSNVLDFYRKHSTRFPASLRQQDYLLSSNPGKYHVVCNPPYLKFQHFEQKEAFLEHFKNKYGINLSGYINIASAFLAKSICELEPGFRLAYIMPSEFLNAGYGRQVKELLIQKHHLAYIIQLECEQEAFSDAITSLCILLYDTSRQYDRVTFHSIDSLKELGDILFKPALRSIPVHELLPSHKWGKYLQKTDNTLELSLKNLTYLSNYGHFTRGIATGANEFFVLRASQISQLSLSSSDYCCCISKSAQISKAIFTQDDFDNLTSQDAPVFLFNAGPKPSPAAKQYIRYGESVGYQNGYITRNRTPWYKMENRAPAPIMLNVFSRNGYKVVRNLTSVQSLTNYHCFYPNLFGMQRIETLFLYLLSEVGHRILSSSMRKYGNQLDKFEPNDLNQAYVPSEDFLDSIPSSHADDLMNRLNQGENIHEEINEMFQSLTCQTI